MIINMLAAMFPIFPHIKGLNASRCSQGGIAIILDCSSVSPLSLTDFVSLSLFFSEVRGLIDR